jgi:hypothetical protein
MKISKSIQARVRVTDDGKVYIDDRYEFDDGSIKRLSKSRVVGNAGSAIRIDNDEGEINYLYRGRLISRYSTYWSEINGVSYETLSAVVASIDSRLRDRS